MLEETFLNQYFRSLCIKDQIGDVLAELMEIRNGLEATGISSDTIKKRGELWQIMLKSGSFFSLSAEEFLDELIAVFSELQIRKTRKLMFINTSVTLCCPSTVAVSTN